MGSRSSRGCLSLRSGWDPGPIGVVGIRGLVGVVTLPGMSGSEVRVGSGSYGGYRDQWSNRGRLGPWSQTSGRLGSLSGRTTSCNRRSDEYLVWSTIWVLETHPTDHFPRGFCFGQTSDLVRRWKSLQVWSYIQLFFVFFGYCSVLRMGFLCY